MLACFKVLGSGSPAKSPKIPLFEQKIPLFNEKDLKHLSELPYTKLAYEIMSRYQEGIPSQDLMNIIQNFIKKKSVKDVENCLEQQKTLKYVKTVKILSVIQKTEKQTLNIIDKKTEKEDRGEKEIVYNLTVDGAGCYYANNVLVSNCDAADMAFSIWRYYGGMDNSREF